MTARILVIDDEPQIRRVMRTTLVASGYVVTDARSGEEGLQKLRDARPDLILLDLNMPGMGGMAACREIRHAWDGPIIVLSVRGGDHDKVEALDAGADDYVTKPFSTTELLARIRAALRRAPTAWAEDTPPALVLGCVRVDFRTRRIIQGDSEVRLTPKEFDLLEYLVAHAGTVIPHARLLQAVWGPDYGNEVEYLRVFINHLRKKVEVDPASPRFILTEPRVGYRFERPPASDTDRPAQG
ncbi:MAG TPA: response regulator transcription factor [Vicinamibacterales bacterium]|jgi:two-component system KDP operon response regulator KdpE